MVKAVNYAHWCIVPGEYSWGVNAEESLEKDLGIKLLFKSCFGAAIHQKINGKYALRLHRDEMDYGLSCLVPWGNFEGRDLELV